MNLFYFIIGALAVSGLVTLYSYVKQIYENCPTEEEVDKPQAAELEKAEQAANLARNNIKEVQVEKKDLTPQEIALFFNGPFRK